MLQKQTMICAPTAVTVVWRAWNNMHTWDFPRGHLLAVSRAGNPERDGSMWWISWKLSSFPYRTNGMNWAIEWDTSWEIRNDSKFQDVSSLAMRFLGMVWRAAEGRHSHRRQFREGYLVEALCQSNLEEVKMRLLEKAMGDRQDPQNLRIDTEKGKRVESIETAQQQPVPQINPLSQPVNDLQSRVFTVKA